MDIFRKANPIWAKDRETEMNIHLGFKTILDNPRGESVVIKLSAVTMYRLYINNNFISFGPARAAQGYNRVDVIDITKYCIEKRNIIAVEVVAQNSKSYNYCDQTGFFACEIEVGGNIIKYTDTNEDFSCGIVSERIRKVQRLSFQRAFCEAYRFEEGFDSWRIFENHNLDTQLIIKTEPKCFISRYAPYQMYEKLYIDKVVGQGTLSFHKEIKNPNFLKNFVYPEENYKRYNYEEFEVYITDETQKMRFSAQESTRDLCKWYKFPQNSYRIFDMGYNSTGMTVFDIIAKGDVTVYLLFDEIMVDADIDFLRAGVSNVLRLEFKCGSYHFMSFEPLGYKYVKLVVTGGACEIGNYHLCEYKHPPVDYRVNIPKENNKLWLIYNAAVETYRQNAVDIFMDCPSRERAGWLCDSFFTARVEKCLTEKGKIEYSFLENFSLPDSFQYIPKGMLPMCYPADHPNCQYIPNWAMWFVCELAEYKCQRNGDMDLVNKLKPRVYALWDFFKGYENEYGLLENLEQWVFVEWSKANELVQDVNYPTNMLYALMLEGLYELYEDEAALQKSVILHEIIRNMSFNGEFFTDNALRKEGELNNTNMTTEVCQYYAFFCKTATPNLYPDLWNKLLKEFGPYRGDMYPNVYPSNAFIGNYLRLEAMMQNGEYEAVLKNIEGYFYDMAVQTGTLWEHYDTRASCNHGFASHVIYWLDKIYMKESIKTEEPE